MSQQEAEGSTSVSDRINDEIVLMRMMMNALDGAINLGYCIITREKGCLFHLREMSSNKQFVFGTAEEVVNHILRHFW